MESLLLYSKSLNSSDEIIQWLNIISKKQLADVNIITSDLEHVIDWMNSSDAPKRLLKMSVKDAVRLSGEWMDRNKSKGQHLQDSIDDIQNFMTFDDGSKMV